MVDVSDVQNSVSWAPSCLAASDVYLMVDFVAKFAASSPLGLQGGEVNFGVADYNGLVQPRAVGPEPSVELANNRSLSGSAVWNCVLLGMDSHTRPVRESSSLAIDLNSLDGTLDFRSIRFLDAGAGGR